MDCLSGRAERQSRISNALRNSARRTTSPCPSRLSIRSPDCLRNVLVSVVHAPPPQPPPQRPIPRPPLLLKLVPEFKTAVQRHSFFSALAISSEIGASPNSPA